MRLVKNSLLIPVVVFREKSPIFPGEVTIPALVVSYQLRSKKTIPLVYLFVYLFKVPTFIKHIDQI